MSKATPEVEEERLAWQRRDFLDVMAEAIETYNPVKRYVLFSGGNDSTSLLHYCVRHELVDAAVHINTGIGVEETREFVRKTCRDWHVPLIEKHPPKPYDEIVLKHGFPGPGGHRFMYIMLKERAVREVVREAKTKRSDTVLLITGVRKSESDRRMGYVDYIVKAGAMIWGAPLADYTKGDLIDYRLEHNLPENEVSALLHMSGECLCGAFAKPGEIRDLEIFYPGTAKRIHDLEQRARAAGQRHCVWGVRPQGSRAKRRAPAGRLCTDCVDLERNP